MKHHIVKYKYTGGVGSIIIDDPRNNKTNDQILNDATALFWVKNPIMASTATFEIKEFKIRASMVESIMAPTTERKTFHVDDFSDLDAETIATIFGKRKTATRELLEPHRHIPQISAALYVDPLSTGAKTYAKKWLKRQLTCKKELPLAVKQIQKGIQMENHGINLLMDIDNEFYTKNGKNFQNEWISGTPDIITDSEIIDIKLPWDVDSHPMFDELNSLYWWQMQAYMFLCDKQTARVVYLLIDCPESILESQIRRAEWDGISADDVRAALTFGDVETKYKVVQFRVYRDNDAITAIKQRVNDIQIYINELLLDFTSNAVKTAKNPLKK